MPAITGNLGPQANAGFSPISIAGCQLWFDAADPSTLTLNGSTVASWRDKSANGYSVGQATTANQPTYATNLLNGLAGIQLSSSTYLYQVGSSIPNFSSSASTTVIMVAKNGSTIPATGWNIVNTMWFNGGAQGPTYRYHLSFAIGTTNGIALYAGPAITQVGQLTVVPLGANAILGFTISPSGNSINANGTLTTYTGTTAPNASNGTWFLFGDARGQQFQSDVNVYEFLGFNTTLSTTDRQNVEGYLAQKWGLTANLPPGHPGITTNYVASQPRIFRIGPLPGTRTRFLVTANQFVPPVVYTLTVAPDARYSLLTSPSGTIANTGSSGSIGAATIVNTSYTATAPSYATFARVGVNQSGGYILAPSITGIRTLVLIVRVTNTTPPAYFLDTRTGLGAGYLYSSSGSDHIGPDWTSATYYRDTVNTTFSGNFIAALQDGAWHHVCLQRASFTSAITFLARYSLTETLGCDCGEIMIFTGALTAQQVKDNYNFFSSRFGWTPI